MFCCSLPLNSSVGCTEFPPRISFLPILATRSADHDVRRSAVALGPLRVWSMPQYFRGIFHSCMGTSPMIFMSHLHLVWKLLSISKALDKWAVLLAVSTKPWVAPIDHLALESCHETWHTSSNNVSKHFYILKTPHMYVLWDLQIWLKIECKMGLFVSVERFNVWHTQRAGSGQFFSTKLSGYHIHT